MSKEEKEIKACSEEQQEHCCCDEKKDQTCTCDHKECHKDKKHKHDYKKKIQELEEKNKELEEKSLRAHAELINFRKRKEEETTRLLKYSNEALVKELLPTLDNFGRAINMDDDNLEDEVSKFLQGFKMLYCNFANVLEHYDVKEIDSLNKPFDPTYHQAVMTEKREGVEAGMVIEVLQKGYMLKDKVIRPTMVKVSE